MNFCALFKKSSMFKGLWIYTINHKYEVALWLGKNWNCCPKDDNLDISNYVNFEVEFCECNSTMPMSDLELRKLGIDLPKLDSTKRHYHYVPGALIEDAILKLERAVGGNVVAAMAVPVTPEEPAKDVCSECKGKKILDFGFYKRACMKCYKRD